MQDNIWQLQEAKSKFSQLIENAMNKAPQIVTKHGAKAVVVLSFEDYAQIIKPKVDLVNFLRSSPLAEEEVEITRIKDVPRDVEL